LDMEAAHNFPANVDVVYSWGRPDYKYTQYIHRSGILLAQITDDGDFLLLANKLYNNRAMSFSKTDRSDRHTERNGRLASASSYPQTTPFASPMLRATIASSPIVHASADVLGTIAPSKTPSILTPESVAHELESLCSDASRLDAFYKDVLSASPAASTPRLRSSLRSYSSADANMDVPVLGLPPGFLASRELSPSPMSLSAPRLGRRSSAHPSDASGSVHDSPRPAVIG